MTYKEYLRLRRNGVKPHELVPGHTYYIEKNDDPPSQKTIYKGIFSNIDPIRNKAIFTDKEGKSTVQILFDPFNTKTQPYEFSINPIRYLFFNDIISINKNVDHLVYTLTGKQKNMIGPIPRGHTREMGLPKDAATIIALNLEDPKRISTTARRISMSKSHKSSRMNNIKPMILTPPKKMSKAANLIDTIETNFKKSNIVSNSNFSSRQKGGKKRSHKQRTRKQRTKKH